MNGVVKSLKESAVARGVELKVNYFKPMNNIALVVDSVGKLKLGKQSNTWDIFFKGQSNRKDWIL